MPTLTPTTEDYLQAIDALRTEVGDVRAARMAERLGISPASVSQTLDRMIRQDLVEVAADHRIQLTESGRQAADSINRRHRLTERFLVDTLGLDWVSAHEEAHRLEHAISEQVEARLSALLGHPETCPHGAPIPGNFPAGSDSAWRPLSSFQAGDKGNVARVSEAIEEDTELLRYCDEKNLHPGVRFLVSEVGPDGVFVLELGAAPVVVSARLASHISCTPDGSD
ncbi:MAG TPA: metal-dependent transcriptional regulator [Dehalococcoidia bacterium]|nr:metal-dependent transcriptional regulator [Dehalococcoidia bacterium]